MPSECQVKEEFKTTITQYLANNQQEHIKTDGIRVELHLGGNP